MDKQWLIETVLSPLIFLVIGATILFVASIIMAQWPEAEFDKALMGALVGAAITRIKLSKPSNGN